MKFLQIYFARFKLQHYVLKLDYPKLSKHTTKIKISASQMSTTSWSHFEVHNSSIVVYVCKFQNRNQQHPLKIINWASTSVKSYFIQYVFVYEASASSMIEQRAAYQTTLKKWRSHNDGIVCVPKLKMKTTKS